MHTIQNEAKIGVFLCQCGNQIDTIIDLGRVGASIETNPGVAHCETLPYPCQAPGLSAITGAVAGKGLNRVIIAGCESRLMLGKFEDSLAPQGLFKGQIDVVNLRGHVAAVSDLAPAEKADKSIRLINGAVAEMTAVIPTPRTPATLQGPVMIVGGGLASFAAARELSSRQVEFLLALDTTDPEKIVATLHSNYPGERAYEPRLRAMVREVLESPQATVLSPVALTGVTGITGDYTLTLSSKPDETPVKYKAGALVACLDAEMAVPGPEFGYDGQSVKTQPEMEALISKAGAPKGSACRVVFWVSDHETGQGDFALLSAKSAWNIACNIRESSASSQVTILHHHEMKVPLSAAERAAGRRLGIRWIPYDGNLRPTVQDRLVTFCNLTDHVEHELEWDYLVLSPVRHLNAEARRSAAVLGLMQQNREFLGGRHVRVRPEMVGREETYVAGSARWPCDLQETLAQGRRAAAKTAEMLSRAAAGELYLPRIVAVVDPEKCIGCGQCQELCDCGSIGVEEGPGGGLPRIVDPMTCIGGGTCAASCPFHALVLQNNSTDQREARVAALSAQLTGYETLAIGCVWGGLPAADNAGKLGLKYDPQIHIMGVNCVGQIDPCVMARAFLEGAPGLILVGCNPETCHHSYGVDHAWSRVNMLKKLLTLSGFHRERIALAHADLNNPQEFVKTVESFSRTIGMLGPIERNRENIDKLQAIYELTKYNNRVRQLLSASLRRPWEKTYRGDQRHALDYDRDFSAVIQEEFLQRRLLGVLKQRKKPQNLRTLAVSLSEDEGQVAEGLWNLVSEGAISMLHENREAFYQWSMKTS